MNQVINVVRESTSETLSFSMNFKPKSSGTYGICLDNRSSRFTSKTVQVRVRRVNMGINHSNHSVIVQFELILILPILTLPSALHCTARSWMYG